MADDDRAASKVAVADRQMSDAEALMWRVEKDPFLASTFGAVTILDRAPDFDRLRARMESAVHAVPRLGWRVQPEPHRARRSDLGRRSRLRHRPPRPPRRPAGPRHAPPAARPRQPVRARPARSHPPAVAVPRRRRAAKAARRRCSRRCTTRSPTGSTACACRCSTSTSPATPPNRPAERSSAHEAAPAAAAAPRSTRCAELRPRHVPAADQHRPPGRRAARRSRRRSRRQGRPRSTASAAL